MVYRFECFGHRHRCTTVKSMHIVCVSAQTQSRRKKKNCDRSSRFVRVHSTIYWYRKRSLNSIWLIVVRYISSNWYVALFDCIFPRRSVSFFVFFYPTFVRLFILSFRSFYDAQFACKTLFSLISNGIRLTLITSNFQLCICVFVTVRHCNHSKVPCCFFIPCFLCSARTHSIVHLLFTGDSFGSNLCTFF